MMSMVNRHSKGLSSSGTSREQAASQLFIRELLCNMSLAVG
jgi:hypothetical protein